MDRHQRSDRHIVLRGFRAPLLRTTPARFFCESLEQRTLLSALTWSAGPSLPTARGDAVSISNYNGTFVFGGSTSAGTSSSAVKLVVGASAWTSAPPLDRGRSAAGIGETGNVGPITSTGDPKYLTDIFIYGGASSTTPTTTVLNYDTAGDNPTGAPAMSAARSSFAYATDPATGDLYAIGGLGASSAKLASAEVYDPTADAWAPIAPLPHPIYGGAGASDGAGHILVFGGDDSAGHPLDTVYRYTIATNTWDSASPLPAALARSSAVYAAYGLIYVLGGITASGATANVEAYNPVTDMWADETRLPNAVYGATANIDVNGNVQLIGGYNSAGARVANVWTSPVGPAPVGLPVPATLTLNNSYAVYNGTPQPVSPVSLATDGVTPVDGIFDVTYDGSPNLPTAAGLYQVQAIFTSNDPNYVNGAITGTLYIDRATPTITLTGGGTFTYNGQPHAVTASEVGIDGVNPVAGSFSITYNGLSTAPVNAGSYAVVANFTSADPNYANASASTTIVIPDPTIPTGVTVAGASTTSIQVSWNTAPIPVSGYNVYQRHVLHDPKGSGSTIYYTLVASTTGTSVILGVSLNDGGTFAVSSVSPTGVVSTRSLNASGSALYAPSLYGVLTSSGAVVSSITGEVGQTVTATILAYGNRYPAFTMLSGPSTMSVDPVTGVITYVPVISDMGTVYATFQATNSIGTATETIPFNVIGLPAVQVTGGTFTFDGAVHTATAVAYAIDGVTPLAGTFTFTYSPIQYPQAISTSPYAEPGTYIVHATFSSSTAAYGGASGTGLLTILPAVPGTTGNDVITLVRDVDGTQIDWSMGSFFDRVSINDANGLIINGNGGSDTINLDYANGNPLPNNLHLNGTFTINGLQGRDPLAGTTLDIGRSTVFIAYADPTSDPLTTIRNDLQTGYNSGQWTGVASESGGAITSTAAAADSQHLTAIGYADSTSTIVALPANTIELKYTLYGDTGLAGSVGFADFTRLSQHFNQSTGATWASGDFNYDGVVSAADMDLLRPTYGQTLPPPPAPAMQPIVASPTGSSNADTTLPTAVVDTGTVKKHAAKKTAHKKHH